MYIDEKLHLSLSRYSGNYILAVSVHTSMYPNTRGAHSEPVDEYAIACTSRGGLVPRDFISLMYPLCSFDARGGPRSAFIQIVRGFVDE